MGLRAFGEPRRAGKVGSTVLACGSPGSRQCGIDSNPLSPDNWPLDARPTLTQVPESRNLFREDEL